MFHYVNRARVAFVHQVRTNGPRGGKLKAWEARAEGNHVATVGTKRGAIAVLENYLKTGIRPAHETWGR